MKAEITENKYGFAIKLNAENVDDCAKLVRFGTNWKKEIRYINVCAIKEGDIEAYVDIGKISRSTSCIQRAK